MLVTNSTKNTFFRLYKKVGVEGITSPYVLSTQEKLTMVLKKITASMIPLNCYTSYVDFFKSDIDLYHIHDPHQTGRLETQLLNNEGLYAVYETDQFPLALGMSNLRSISSTLPEAAFKLLCMFWIVCCILPEFKLSLKQFKFKILQSKDTKKVNVALKLFHEDEFNNDDMELNMVPVKDIFKYITNLDSDSNTIKLQLIEIIKEQKIQIRDSVTFITKIIPWEQYKNILTECNLGLDYIFKAGLIYNRLYAHLESIFNEYIPKEEEDVEMTMSSNNNNNDNEIDSFLNDLELTENERSLFIKVIHESNNIMEEEDKIQRIMACTHVSYSVAQYIITKNLKSDNRTELINSVKAQLNLSRLKTQSYYHSRSKNNNNNNNNDNIDSILNPDDVYMQHQQSEVL
jgi:hypothetical protein